jgi:AcrR family transcriptional regulator
MNNDSRPIDATAVEARPAPTRKEKEQQARRDAILDAAEAVIGAKGYHQASMREIAARAEFSTGSLYGFFDNKEALYFGVLERKAEHYLTAARAEVDRDADPVEKLHRLVASALGFFENNEDFFKIMVSAQGGFEWGAKDRTSNTGLQLQAAWLDLVADLISQGVAAHGWSGGNPKDLASALTGTINGVAFRWLTEAEAEPLSARAPQVADLFLHGCAGPRGGPGKDGKP